MLSVILQQITNPSRILQNFPAENITFIFRNFESLFLYQQERQKEGENEKLGVKLRVTRESEREQKDDYNIS